MVEQGSRAKVGFVDLRTQRPSKPNIGFPRAYLCESSVSRGVVRIGASVGTVVQAEISGWSAVMTKEGGFYLQVRKGLRSEPRQTMEID